MMIEETQRRKRENQRQKREQLSEAYNRQTLRLTMHKSGMSYVTPMMFMAPWPNFFPAHLKCLPSVKKDLPALG